MNKLTNKQTNDIKKVMSLFNDGLLTENEKIAQIKAILKIVDTVVNIPENMTGKKLETLQAKKIGLNKAYKEKIGGFNFILGLIKEHGEGFLQVLNKKYILNITMEDIQILKAADLSPFMTEKQRAKYNVSNLFTMWLIASLIGLYFKSKATNKAKK